MVSGHHVPILSAWSALTTKEIKQLQVLFSVSLSFAISVSLAQAALSGSGAGWVTVQRVRPGHSSMPPGPRG